MADTAVEAIGEIVTNLGGTLSEDADTVVEALEELKALLGEGGIEAAVQAYFDEHGVDVGYSVDGSGDLSITLT